MKIRLFLKKQQGFIFVETMVSLSILLISVTGTLVLFTIGYRNLIMPKNLVTAVNIAHANMEEIRNAPIVEIKGYDNTSGIPERETSFLPTSLPDGQLMIGIDDSNPDFLTLAVIVSWQDDGKPNRNEIKLVTMVTAQ